MLPRPKASILNIEPYKAGISKVKGSSKKIIKLSSNETPLGASPKAIAAYMDMANNLHRYPDSSASELRQAIGEVHNLSPDRIVCGAGSDEILSLLCVAYLSEGDEALYSEYGFLMYPISTMAAGGIPKKAGEKNLTTNVDSILASVTEKTRIVFIANPNNPTGTYINRNEIRRLRKGLPANVLLVLDSAYAEYVIENDYTAGEDIVDMGENTVMTRTFSKIYGLAGLRLGWAYCPEPIADILNRVRGPFNVSSPAIAAGIAAVRDVEFINHARSYNQACLTQVCGEINKIGLKAYKSSANFFLVEFPQGNKNSKNADQFLKDHGIIVRAIDSYGLANYLRFTVGSEEDNRFVVDVLKEFLQ